MATIAGVDCDHGGILAGDRRVVKGDTVSGQRRHVFDLDGALAAAVGSDVDEFRRRLDAEVREHRTTRGEPRLETVTRLASPIAERTDVEAIVAGRDDDGRTGLRTLTGGVVLADDVAAFGAGAAVVLGRLEGADDLSLGGAESRLREAFSAAAEREAGTGDELDVLRLEDAAGTDQV